ncbi:MAG: hypothetical protein GTO53_08625 [Planctomycetales bacterium]|nr:hypothetical protein [Planctomycetales bacterium]NIM09192.1 hypothetical protein [Planctomycetales bacterium]NIN08668.1 hypothetical protein [Planctomycetales bacterium]NIN77787.1 hypothetical protein [Planctomycetales bacterium]NIO34964.1 hypothetical protein [Planctomycetales bacterium]
MSALQPIHCRPAAYDFFTAQLPQLNKIDRLLNAALAVSMHELTDVKPRAVRGQLDALADRVRSRVRGNNQQALLAHLHSVLFDEQRLGGNLEDYHNPANSYLSEVLKTGRGIPITLTLIYKYVAQQLGLTVHGVNAPAHFLACVRMEGHWTLVDPFFAGRILSRAEAIAQIEQITGRALPAPHTDGEADSPLFHDPLFPIATHAQWLARIVRNLRGVFQKLDREQDVLAMVDLFRLL